MINLFINHYKDEDSRRCQEYDTCLLNNISNKFIDKIYVLASDKLLFKNKKIKSIKFDERPMYYDFIEIVNMYSSVNDINIVANLDIYFNETINLIHNIKNNQIFALTIEEYLMPTHHYNKTDSQDVWIWKGEIINCDLYKIPLGFAGCDNAIIERFERNGYKILNPSLSIKVKHEHKTMLRRYLGKKVVDKPYKLLEPAHIEYTLPKTINTEFDLPKPIDVKKESVIKKSNKNIKIFHVGLYDSHEPQESLRSALASLGEYREATYNGRKEQINDDIVRISDEFNPTIVFMQIQSANIVSENSLKVLKNGGAFVINWTGDVRQPLPEWYIETGRLVDLTLFTNTNDVYYCRERGIKSDYLQIGYNDKIYNELLSESYLTIKSADIVFMANHYPFSKFPLSNERLNTAKSLTNRYGDDFKLYGTGWSSEFQNIESLMYKQHLEADAYRLSKVAINLSHFNLSRYSSDRLLRIMACGSLCLCQRYVDCELDYKDGVHLRYWDTIDELYSLIDYYINPENEIERQKIAKKGQRYIQERCTWSVRMEELKKILHEGILA